jgi:hypothetical protein
MPATARVVIQTERAAIRTERGSIPGDKSNVWRNGSVGEPVRNAPPLNSQVVVRGHGSPAEGIWPETALLFDGRAVKTVHVEYVEPQNYELTVELPDGTHEVAAGFLNDAVIDREDRNLRISPPSSSFLLCD